MPISSFKDLEATHPEVLAKWRSQRAARFITTLKNPLAPPEQRPPPAHAFKLAGKTNAGFPVSEMNTHKTRKAPDLSRSQSIPEVIDTARVKESLRQLTRSLDQTNEEIARQELKIALKSKTKNYQR